MPETRRALADTYDSASGEQTLNNVLSFPVPTGSDAGLGEEPGANVWAGLMAVAEAAIEQKDYAAAAAILNSDLLPADAPLATQLELAGLLAKARQHEQSDALFEALLTRFPGERKLHFTYGKHLHARGLLVRATQVLETSDPFPAETAQQKFVERVLRLCGLLEAREKRRIGTDENCRILAMKHAIDFYADRSVPALAPDQIGHLVLMTGSLGPGGAERQLVRTAAELETARRRDGQVDGIAIRKPVEVIVRSHSGAARRDFYLDELRRAEVGVTEIEPMVAQSTRDLGIENEDLCTLVDYLPPKVNFGVRRLVRHFRETCPEVVSIWQDGACLFAGLAAVMAGVPKVQLVIRGLPPVIRTHMFQPEYEAMYKSLAAVPGVEFISNSKAAAVAYAEWLDIPLERFAILHNGVQKMAVNPSEERDALWQDFLARTPDATHTVGGVFRFDTDKRPVTWIRFAARYARRYPDARFLIVGSGRLFDEAVELAVEKGVADRILFVGQSSEVGYWMAKMDVLVLLSSFEGLPNVLIEAQYLAVPVVSTPAGGAGECFIEGVSGHILGCAHKPDLDEACDKVQALLGRARDPGLFGPVLRDYLEPNFSVTEMIANFVKLSCYGQPLSRQDQVA